MIDAAILDAMVKAGCTPKQLLAVVKADELAEKEKQANRREKNRIYQRNHRARKRGQHLSAPVSADTLFPLEGSPEPLPKTSISHTSSLRSEDARARMEFHENFWPAYPNKVGKPEAERAFAKARRRAPLDAILAGLERYRAKTDDRQWCNPATWLNQDRWNDQPAAVVPAARGPPQASMLDVIRRRMDEEQGYDGPTIEASEYDGNQLRAHQAVLRLATPKRET